MTFHFFKSAKYIHPRLLIRANIFQKSELLYYFVTFPIIQAINVLYKKGNSKSEKKEMKINCPFHYLATIYVSISPSKLFLYNFYPPKLIMLQINSVSLPLYILWTSFHFYDYRPTSLSKMSITYHVINLFTTPTTDILVTYFSLL